MHDLADFQNIIGVTAYSRLLSTCNLEGFNLGEVVID